MLNHCVIQGRIVTKLVTTDVGEGEKAATVCSFRIANDDDWHRGAHTNFLQCVAWNRNAEYISRNADKGDEIIVSGKVRQHEFVKDGVQKQTVEIQVESVKIIR